MPLKPLVDTLYDSALDPAGLPSFLRALAQHFGTEFAQFLVRSRESKGFIVNVMSGFDDNEPARFEQDFAFQEEQAPWISGDAESFRNTAYFQDRLRLQGIGHALWLSTHDDDGPGALIGVFRRVGAPPFTEAERSRLEVLRAHLPHAVRLLARVAELEAQTTLVTGLAESTVCAAVVTDAAAQIAYANSPARRILEDGDGVSASNGVLTAASARQTRALHDTIRRIARAARDGDLAAVSQAAMSLERHRDARPLGCVIRPLPQRTGVLNGRKALVHVHLAPPEPPPAPPIGLLRGLFGLTQAEARLLQALVQGKRIEEYAIERSVAVTTVRTQLAHLFRKTDTNRQTELVRLALMSAGVLPP